MSAILKSELEELMITRELVITPILDRETQIGDSSVDVRLGNEFIVIHKTRLLGLDLKKSKRVRRHFRKYQSRVRVKYGTGFILHPGQLVLGATLEYLRLPSDITAYVIGRSSWGRMGLVVATATNVAPGFCGSLTLEFVNMGEVPLTIYPGIRIAQLVFHRGPGEGAYTGRHRCATGPEFSKILDDKDLQLWSSWDSTPEDPA